MGFKRTAEGRVFFENPSGEENQDNKDLQVVGLLRALNERLKTAQSERARLLRDMERYEGTIEDLKERAARSEQAYIDLEQKVSSRQNENIKKVDRTEQVTKETLQELMDTREMLAELQEKTTLTEISFSTLKEEISERKKTEDLLRKHQLALEKLHKDQNEKIVGSVAAYVALTKRVNESESKFDRLDNKIEEAVVEHNRLERKIEKAIQDRSRLLRKIDRIEETVIQTRDALNAKAMVVLADQGVHGLDGIATQKLLGEDPPPALLENQTQAGQAWWQKAGFSQAAGTAMVLLVVLLAGLFLSRINLPEWRTFDKEQFSFLEGKILPEPADKVAEQNTEKWLPVFSQEDVSQAQEDQPETIEDFAAEIEPEAGQVVNQMEIADVGAADDIGTLDLNDEDQLLAALENDPDGLAAQLNVIEPSSIDAVSDTVGAVQEEAAVQPIVSPEVKEAAKAVEVEDNEPVMTLAPRPGLEGRIKPDPALTKVVKEIEVQAFAGVPEAQHDLAAIYTAGHGGVKQNYKRAGLWFREAAEGGIANARYNLGVLYHQGLGVGQDTAEAIKWYKSAAALGHPEAQYNLGIAYIEGVGVPYNPRKAEGYFKSAADNGIMEASYNLGLIYENALLGKAQPDEALRWYKIAADAGSPEAKAALEQLAKTLNIKLSDVNKLVESISSNGAAAPVTAPALAPVVKKAASKKAARVAPAPVPAPEPVKQEPKAATDIEPAAGEVLAAGIEPSISGRALTAQIQQYLMQLGLYPGPADGLRGPLTRDAIRSYQLFNDLEDTGEATEALLSHMRNDPQINEVGSRAQ